MLRKNFFKETDYVQVKNVLAHLAGLQMIVPNHHVKLVDSAQLMEHVLALTFANVIITTLVILAQSHNVLK